MSRRTRIQELHRIRATSGLVPKEGQELVELEQAELNSLWTMEDMAQETAEQSRTVQLQDVQILMWGQDVVEAWASAEDSIERRHELSQEDVRVLSLSVQGGEKAHECWSCTREDCYGCDKVARLAEFDLGRYAEDLLQDFPCWLCGGDAYLDGYGRPHTVHCSHGDFDCPNKHRSISVQRWIMACFESAAAKQLSAVWVSRDGDGEPLLVVPDVGQHPSELGGGCIWTKLQLSAQAKE